MTSAERTVSLAQKVVVVAARESFQTFQALRDPFWDSTPYSTHAVYDDGVGEQKVVLGYDDLLPKLERRKGATEIVDEKVARLGDGQKVSILDVGCWMGFALAEMDRLKKTWDGKLNLNGITASIPAGQIVYLQKQGIEVKQADIGKLREVYAGRQFDLIISSKTFCYLVSLKEAVEATWDLLAPRGVALVYFFYWPEEGLNEIRELNRRLEQRKQEVRFLKGDMTKCFMGRCFRTMCLTIEKREAKTKLDLPIYPVDLVKPDRDYPPILLYRLQK